MTEKCHICKNGGEIPVKVNSSFDKFETKFEDKFICKICFERIKQYEIDKEELWI